MKEFENGGKKSKGERMIGKERGEEEEEEKKGKEVYPAVTRL